MNFTCDDTSFPTSLCVLLEAQPCYTTRKLCPYSDRQASKIELTFLPKPRTEWELTASSNWDHSYNKVNQFRINNGLQISK